MGKGADLSRKIAQVVGGKRVAWLFTILAAVVVAITMVMYVSSASASELPVVQSSDSGPPSAAVVDVSGSTEPFIYSAALPANEAGKSGLVTYALYSQEDVTRTAGISVGESFLVEGTNEYARTEGDAQEVISANGGSLLSGVNSPSGNWMTGKDDTLHEFFPDSSNAEQIAEHSQNWLFGVSLPVIFYLAVVFCFLAMFVIGRTLIYGMTTSLPWMSTA